jgi:hypothetical protein
MANKVKIRSLHKYEHYWYSQTIWKYKRKELKSIFEFNYPQFLDFIRASIIIEKWGSDLFEAQDHD